MRAEEYIQTAIMLGAKRVNIGTADMFGRELNAHQNRTSENIVFQRYFYPIRQYPAIFRRGYGKSINVVCNRNEPNV